MRKILRNTALILALCTVFSALAGCTIQPGYEGAPENWRPVNEGDEGAILYVPIAWSVETSTGVPTAYVSQNDRTTVTLVTVPAESTKGLEPRAYFESYIESFKSSITDFKFEKEKEEDPDYTNRLIAGVGATVFTYSGKIAGLEYKFRQALLKNSETGCIYIITYSADISLFDQHLDELNNIYNNFRFVTDPIPMKDTVRPETPDSEGVEVPEGMKLISSAHTDYYFFVKSDWIPTVTTGMTSAHAPDSSDNNISCTAFTADFENLDDYWKEYEEDIKNTFGNMTYENGDKKFTETKLDGLLAKLYTYSVTMSDTTTYYAQYVAVYSGQIYFITAASNSFDSARSIEFEIRFK